MHGVKRIIWVGAHGHQTGTMTLAAAAWCQREGIHLVALDGSGMPLLEVTPDDCPIDATLRRQQWVINSGYGVLPVGALAHELVRRKVDGQYATLAKHPDLPGHDAALTQLHAWREWLNLAEPADWQFDLNQLRLIEARLALSYFHAWEGWPLHWAKTDTRRIPPHWLTARSRISPLASQDNARRAVDPLNACLNYCYGCLASQCRQSLLREGLDPTCGFLHAGKPNRDSLTYDLMELERATVDDLLLAFLAKQTLHYGDFAREPSGHVLVHPQLARLLLAECRVPQARIDEHARWLKRFLLSSVQREDAPAE
jgi:CRISPR-associated protein Cas1